MTVCNAYVMGVRFDATTMDRVIERVDDAISSDRQIVMALSNPEFLVECKRNQFLHDYLNSCDLNLADGYGVIWAAKVSKQPKIPERITGTDFLPALAALCAEKGYSIFFYGAKPGVGKKAADLLQKRFPGLRVVGTQHGYIDDQEALIGEINSSGADVCMVCLGNPRQEEWIHANRSRLCSKVVFGNGGALDFHSGGVKRAPNLWIRLHLEWLYRLIQDPSRARFRRQARLVGFVVDVFKARLFRRAWN